MTKEQRIELYAAAKAMREARAAERRAADKVKKNPKHWLRTNNNLYAAIERYEAAKK
jgi:hypothetical protein